MIRSTPDRFEDPEDLQAFVLDLVRDGRGLTDPEVFELHLAIGQSLWIEEGHVPEHPDCVGCDGPEADDASQVDVPFLGLADKLESMTHELLALPTGHGSDDVVAILTRWLRKVQAEHGYDLVDVVARLEATTSTRKASVEVLRRLRETARSLSHRGVDAAIDVLTRYRSKRSYTGETR